MYLEVMSIVVGKRESDGTASQRSGASQSHYEKLRFSRTARGPVIVVCRFLEVSVFISIQFLMRRIYS